MNYVLIESFCALAKRLNFTKAAADLFITQPSLSRNIVMLENELGFQLFHRSKHAVCLTDLGKQFLPYAESIKTANDRAASFAAAIAKNAQSAIIKEVRIGVSTMQFTKFLPALTAYMATEMPEVRFSVTDGLQQDILRQLRDNQQDIIFTEGGSLGDGKGLETLLLRRNYMKLVVPVGHPATKVKGPIPLDTIHEYGLPLLTVDTTLCRRSGELFPGLEIKQMRSATHALTLIEAGLGFSICQEGMRSIFPPSVVFLDLEGNPLYMDATIAWNKEGNPPGWWEKFLHQLKVFVENYTTADAEAI